MRVLSLCMLLLCCFVAPVAFAQPADAPPAEPSPQEQAYQTHMKNGIKLFGESKWDGAVAEFWAAYREKPVGSPLINLALAYKRMKNSPKAIEVLELALSKHRDSLPEAQVAAAETEIKEMKALLAWVTVVIKPDGKAAKLYIDGRLQPDGAWAKPIPLEPGTRTFMVKKSGYDNASVETQLTAGLDNKPVVLELVQKDGRVRIQARQPDAEIRIDDENEGRGTYDDMLPRGVHTVVVVHDDTEHEIRILVRPGGDHTVTQKDDGTLESEAKVDDDVAGDPFGPPKVLETFRGVYGYGGGSLLTVLSDAGGENFEPSNSADRWGAGASLHLGYRVAEWAAFEFWGQYSDVRVGGKVTLPLQVDGAPNQFAESQMILKSGRFGLLFRGLLPGKSWIRFVGTLGAGVLVEKLSWRFSQDGRTAASPADRGLFVNTGVDVGVFGSLDLGVEAEWSNVLFALMFQHTLQGTKHFDDEQGNNVFGGDPVLVTGPSIRVGYGLW